MSDWLRKRREYEEERARIHGMERVSHPPDWVKRAVPDEFHERLSEGDSTTLDGDAHAYKIISNGDGGTFFRARKSEYYTTTRNQGICPSCEAYVRRFSDDRFLTCHRCGWTVGRPGLRWLRYPSWIDRLVSSVVSSLRSVRLRRG